VSSAIEELDRVAELCAGLDFGVPDGGLAHHVLEPIATLVGAETASLRRFGRVNGVPTPLSIVDISVPGSVRDAYLNRYFELDPIRPFLARRVAGPLFADPARRGEWSDRCAEPIGIGARRQDFRRYRREFLLPNHFHHHLGFCVQTSTGEMIALDFHRPARSRDFGALERARARVVASYLHSITRATSAAALPAASTPPDLALTSREAEVADAVSNGLSNKQVALELGISVRTVENHLRSIFSKCNVTTRTRMAAKLRRSRGPFVSELELRVRQRAALPPGFSS
jgi:DNA-binding CsgD family transcriptional regulator